MDPAVDDDPDRPGLLDDPEAWSGSDDPEGPYCSQDEAYYGESESDTEPQNDQEFSYTLDPHFDHRPENQPSPKSSFSDYSQEDPEPHPDSLSGVQNDRPQENEDPGNLESSLSECTAHTQKDHQPYASGSSSPDQAVNFLCPRKQLALESLDSLESEEEEKEGRGGGGIEAAPPASYVTDGIQAQHAEAAGQWGAASLTESTKVSRQRARHACLRQSERQSEKHLKEAISKCKRIAQLLTAAPNPESKGVLMFKKRRQRVRKFTLVSYGTQKPADDSFEDECGFEENKIIGQDFRFSLPATSESEFEEDYSFNVQGQGAALNYYYDYSPQEKGIPSNYNWEKMEQLPQTKGRGVLMFAQRRQRIDEISAEHEEMRQRGIPVEAFVEPETSVPSVPALQEEATPVYHDVQVMHQLQSREPQYQQQMAHQPNTGINGLDPYQVTSISKPLVSNRTAKPFGGLNQAATPYSPVKVAPSPTSKKHDNMFKVPTPVNTSPQVWSPTGDIIASRDERIAVPAIKSGILPEMKRRGTNKADSKTLPAEDDYLSLGAEACNFMQAPAVRQKKPPPVLPKPNINPACPPWSAEARNPSSPIPAHQNWAPPQPQPATKPWAPSPTQPVPQQHMSAWIPSNPSASYQATWPSEPQQASVSIKSPSTPHAAPSQSKTPWIKTKNDASSVTSCPPQQGSSYFHASKAPPASSRGHTSETGLSDGPTLKGKGAELFARRQSRMEKFVVDDETVQANRARPPSPTLSMPSTWKYSPNIRAPPPVSYNPIVSPFYPLAAQKQSLPAASPKDKSKANKEKPKPTPKHLSVVDVMKHQPYQLDTSLFTYNSTPEVKSASPKTSPVPPPESKQTHLPSHLQLHSSGHFPSPTLSPSPVPSSGSAQSFKQRAKPSGPVSVPYPFTRQPAPAKAAATQPPQENLSATTATHDGQSKVPSSSSTPHSITAANASLSSSSFLQNSEMVSRGALPMAPRPKFSAKKAAIGKQWKPVVYSRSRSMSLPPRHSSVSTLSPVSSPGFHPNRGFVDRQMSWVEHPQKPPSPWEAAARNPLGFVDEAFGPQNIQQSITTSVHSAAHRKSLPEPPLEWKRRVSNDPIETPQARTPTLAIPSPTKAFAPASEKSIVYGPPFRPAQPITIGIRYTGTSSLPRNFSLHSSYAPIHRVSWKM